MQHDTPPPDSTPPPSGPEPGAPKPDDAASKPRKQRIRRASVRRASQSHRLMRTLLESLRDYEIDEVKTMRDQHVQDKNPSGGAPDTPKGDDSPPTPRAPA